MLPANGFISDLVFLIQTYLYILGSVLGCKWLFLDRLIG